MIGIYPIYLCCGDGSLLVLECLWEAEDTSDPPATEYDKRKV